MNNIKLELESMQIVGTYLNSKYLGNHKVTFTLEIPVLVCGCVLKFISKLKR